MSDFSLLSTDKSLSTKATWGFTQLLPCSCAVSSVHNHTKAVDHPLPGEGLGDVEKPQQDMAFVLIAPGLAIGCEQIFGLAAVWMYPHEVHLPTLAEAALKLMLLASEGTNWPYAYARMNNTVAHAPLFSEGHIWHHDWWLTQ